MVNRSKMLFDDPDRSDPLEPFDLFSLRSNRYVRDDDEDQMLVFVDGSCGNNGYSNACAGWAVLVGPGAVLKGRLDHTSAQTSNRAELMSVIVALDSERAWIRRGFESIVIASDSLYVTKGYCEWFNKWKRMNWKKSNGTTRPNSDLWRELDRRVRRLLDSGIEVYFWKIPREFNLADKYAKRAVAQDFET